MARTCQCCIGGDWEDIGFGGVANIGVGVGVERGCEDEDGGRRGQRRACSGGPRLAPVEVPAKEAAELGGDTGILMEFYQAVRNARSRDSL